MIRTFTISLILFLALDWVWFSLFMKKFALNQLRPLLKTQSNGAMDVNMTAAIIAYLCMALIVTLFLPNKLTGSYLWTGLLYSAALGFLVFAIFDFTNLALLKDYPLSFVIVDVLWGTFLFACVGGVLKLTNQLF